MARIVVLSPELASQIAAGEVVERPASVVKELIDNALDAGATRVDVEIDAGGISHLQVADDGAGMTPEEAALCVERHATSKIRRFEDLSHVATFGFRGEALPSIASVSRFRLRTRTAESDAGTELSIEAGAKPSLVPAGHPIGTTVEVNDLFFNVPARRKFLRASGTESGHIVDVLEASALGSPEVTFTLTRDGRKVREYLRAQNREERTRALLEGEELASFRAGRGPLAVEAFLGRPERARSGAGGLRIFVNGRPVRERGVAATIAQAYGSVLERGRYPRGVVYLDLPPELVDVNVHPQKSEIRFADPRAVTDAVYGILSRELRTAFSLPNVDGGRFHDAPLRSDANARSPGSANAPTRTSSESAPLEALAPSRETEEQSAPGNAIPAEAFAQRGGASERVDAALVARDVVRHEGSTPFGNPKWSDLKFVAQLQKTYLLCEGPLAIYIIDQHAAAERVTFTRLRAEFDAHAVASQALLFPQSIEVSESEAELAREFAEKIRSVGLEIEVRGRTSLSVHSVPRLLQRASPERLLRDLLTELSRHGGRGFSDAVDKSLATMACHASVRAGDPLNPEEARALMRSLDGADFSGHCPHGRPIVASMSWAELERKVGRR